MVVMVLVPLSSDEVVVVVVVGILVTGEEGAVRCGAVRVPVAGPLGR